MRPLRCALPLAALLAITAPAQAQTQTSLDLRKQLDVLPEWATSLLFVSGTIAVAGGATTLTLGALMDEDDGARWALVGAGVGLTALSIALLATAFDQSASAAPSLGLFPTSDGMLAFVGGSFG